MVPSVPSNNDKQKPTSNLLEILSDLNQAVPNHLADESQTRLTLVCEVIRYRLVQVRQNLKKRLFGLAARNRLSLFLPLSFSPSSHFLSFSIQKQTYLNEKNSHNYTARERREITTQTTISVATPLLFTLLPPFFKVRLSYFTKIPSRKRKLRYCTARNFRLQKISSKATVRQFVRNLFSSNVGRRLLLFGHSVVALLLIVYHHIYEHF